MRLSRTDRGDTIIEVMVAFAVFAMVAIGALTVMNQGTAGAQNTLETTLVRQQVDNQSEMIRFLHQAYIDNPEDTTANSPSNKFKLLFNAAESSPLTAPSAFGADCTQNIPGGTTTRFVLNSQGSAIANVRPIANLNSSVYAPYAQVADLSTSYGLWVEPIVSKPDTTGNSRYIDFHIRACWESASSSPQRTLGTIVRLYVPDNVATGTAGGGASGIPTPPVLPEVTLNSANLERCLPHKNVLRTEADGRPTWALFTISADPNIGVDTSGSPAIWQCQNDVTGKVFSCVNYDSEFNSGNSTGNFDLVIEYADAACGSPDPGPPYSYRVEVYKDGVRIPLDPLLAPTSGGSRTSTAIDIGPVTPTTKIQIRWWNNYAVGGTLDPDFGINKIILKRQGI